MGGYRGKHSTCAIGSIHLEHIQGDTFRALLKSEEDDRIVDIREVAQAAKAIWVLTGMPRRTSGVSVTADWDFDAGKAKTVHALTAKALAAHTPAPDAEGDKLSGESKRDPRCECPPP